MLSAGTGANNRTKVALANKGVAIAGVRLFRRLIPDNVLTYWFIRDDTVNALDRNVLCVVAINQDRGTVVGSLRGIGSGAIPIG